MKVTTPEISWHERDPIYSVDLQPGDRKIRRLVSGGVDKFVRVSFSWHERDPIYSVDLQPGDRKIRRLVSGGVDKFVRVWQIVEDNEGKLSVEFLANLKRHTKAVNVCRFSHDGETLATAGDDAVIIFWKLSKNDPNNVNIFQEDEEDNKENWCMHKVLRGHLEDIYDLCWSADGKYMISGSVDNSAILWDLTKDQKMALLNDHQSFVQGVAWDPKNEFAATLSTDRSCRVYSVSSRTCLHNIKKMSLPSSNKQSPSPEDKEVTESKPKSFRMFHDDTMRSFFRRLTFTPDGELLIAPSGVMETDPVINSTYIFSRHSFTKPSVYLPSPEKVTIAVRCCPIKFQLREVLREQTEDKSNNNLKEWEKYVTLFELPYRMVFAVATEDSVLLYDTQQNTPFGFITNVHYHQLSDVTWSSNGRCLVVASTDGYCTLVSFSDGELGMPYKEPEIVEDGNIISEKTEEKDVAMETDQSDELHLVLDTSNDGSDLKTESADNTAKPKPLEMKVKSADGKPKKIEITTISTLGGDTNASTSSKPMEMKVKSADGKPKNIQITTLSSTKTLPEAPKPEIQVKSADGKPKKVQITTLASFSSPKSKQGSVSDSKVESENQNNVGKGDCKDSKVLSEISDNNKQNKVKNSGDNVNNTDNVPSSGCSTPKQAKSVEEKQTPKRVQVTTLQLFGSPSTPKQDKNENDK